MGTVRFQVSRRAEHIKEVMGSGPNLVPWTLEFVLVHVSPWPPAHTPRGGFWGKREELLPAPNALKTGSPPPRSPLPIAAVFFSLSLGKKEPLLHIVVTGIVCVCVILHPSM